MRRPLAALGLAVSFLTIAPVRLRAPLPPLGAAAPWFPVVGAGVGAAAGAADWLARPSLGPLVAAVISVLVLVVATGALHQDGLADCADGLGVRGDRARRLAVMRESTVGTFGVLAVALWLLLMVAAVASFDRDDAWRALIAAVAVGRWAALVHAAAAPSARPEGLGAGFTVRTADLLAAAVPAVLAVLVTGSAGLAAMAVAVLVAGCLTAWSRSQLGGRTGDTLGAAIALAEVCSLLLLLALG